jgi:hypothetical protein
MGEQSKIEWTDHTFNPWIGCTKVSPACDNCYAEAMMDKRYGRVTWGAGEDRQKTSPSNWKLPYKWDRQAMASGTRPFVFCASLADVFDNEVDPLWRRQLFALIDDTPSLIWLLLTKPLTKQSGRGARDMNMQLCTPDWPVGPQINRACGAEAGLRAPQAQGGSISRDRTAERFLGTTAGGLVCGLNRSSPITFYVPSKELP